MRVLSLRLDGRWVGIATGRLRSTIGYHIGFQGRGGAVHERLASVGGVGAFASSFWNSLILQGTLGLTESRPLSILFFLWTWG